VIGHTKATEEAVLTETRAVHFGHRVIGDVLAKRRLEARQDDAAKDSRSDPAKRVAKRDAAKVAKDAAEQRAETEIETIEAPTTTNLEELASALEGNPAFYEALYSAEFARASGPRKSALRMFLVFEMENDNRDDRKADIEAALAPKK
jgi:ketosteroid isomerase-like protein